MIPFSQKYDPAFDLTLIEQVKSGSQEALEQLVLNHQRFIYNVALKFVKDPDDAADLSQEVLIIMVTKLSQFKAKSSFRTWLYRIVTNHFIKNKKWKSGGEIESFDLLGDFLDKNYNAEEMSMEEHIQYNDLVIKTRNNCMSAMLLCLDTHQRMVFILGAIFNIKSTVAARILDITAENFRQQLSRAKSDLFSFMENKCGLVNSQNPCRCYKKTKGFIKEGKLDVNLKSFTHHTLEKIEGFAPIANEKLDKLMEGKYLRFFKEQPYEQGHNSSKEIVDSLLLDKDLKDLFLLN